MSPLDATTARRFAIVTPSVPAVGQLARRRSAVQLLQPGGWVTSSPSRTVNLYGGYSEGAARRPRSSWAAPTRTSPASCRTRWRATRSTRSSPGRGRPARADTSRGALRRALPVRQPRRHPVHGPSRPASATSGTSARRARARASGRLGRLAIGAGYTWLAATFESKEIVNGESNSTNDAAAAGAPGPTIAIELGDRMLLIPATCSRPTRPPAGIGAVAHVDLLRCRARSRVGTRTTCTNRRHLLPRAGRPRLRRRRRRQRIAQLWVQVIAAVTNLFDRRYSTALARSGSRTAAPSSRAIPGHDGEFRSASRPSNRRARRWMWSGTRFKFWGTITCFVRSSGPQRRLPYRSSSFDRGPSGRLAGIPVGGDRIRTRCRGRARPFGRLFVLDDLEDFEPDVSQRFDLRVPQHRIGRAWP